MNVFSGGSVPNKTVRRSIAMTPDMAERLRQIASTRPRNVTEADLIREAIRLYLDQQEDLIGSRRHFQRSFRDRVDRLEAAFAFQLNVLIFLLTTDKSALQEAVIAAKQHGETLLAQMQAVRELEDSNT